MKRFFKVKRMKRFFKVKRVKRFFKGMRRALLRGDQGMNTVTVWTKEDLAKAVDAHVDEIVVEGELAERIRDGQKLRSVSKLTLATLTTAVAAAPFTGGISLAAAVPIATLTGLQVAVILAVVFVGLALLLAIYKDYEITIEYDSDGSLRVILKRKDG